MTQNCGLDFSKKWFGRTKNQFRSHQFRLRHARVRAWRGDAKTTSRHVAYVGAAGVQPELLAQTRPPWHRCLRVGARAPACWRARARTHMHTLTYKCNICKTGMLAKEWICTVRVRGSGPKSVPFSDPKNWTIFWCVFLFAWWCFVDSCARVNAAWLCVTTSTFGFRIISNTKFSARTRIWEP